MTKLLVGKDLNPHVFLLKAESDRRWRRLLKAIALFFIFDFVVTTSLYLFSRSAINQTNHNARIQRASQLAACLHDNTVASAQITFAHRELAAQRQSLKDALLLPAFRDPKLAALGTANIRRQIGYYDALLKAYTVKDCAVLYG